jgi:signal transduction histidine kinase
VLTFWLAYILTQAVAELVGNALCPIPAGTQIGIHLSPRHESGACMDVQDDGPGIEAKYLSNLAHRFYGSLVWN